MLYIKVKIFVPQLPYLITKPSQWLSHLKRLHFLCVSSDRSHARKNASALTGKSGECWLRVKKVLCMPSIMRWHSCSVRGRLPVVRWHTSLVPIKVQLFNYYHSSGGTPFKHTLVVAVKLELDYIACDLL